MKTIDALKEDLNFTAELRSRQFALASTWGLFSPKAIDEGTQLLIEHLEINPTDDCLDLGCGYGPLGLVMASLAPEGITHMVDKDFVAINYANKNAQANGLPNATAYLSNGLSDVAEEQMFDVIASNVPAKIGGELLEIFLADAQAHLRPGGRLYVVTISGLKDYMKRHLNDRFGNYDKLKQNRTYTAAVTIMK